MKILTATLFLLGILWALITCAVVLSPIGIFLPEYNYQTDDIVFSLAASSLGLVGFWIWIGWSFYWQTGRYLLVLGNTFWMISLIHHVLWAFLIPLGLPLFGSSKYSQSISDFWIGKESLGVFQVWIVVNIIAAIVAMIIEGRVANSENNLSEQVAASDR